MNTQEAILFIIACRETHQLWIEFLEEHPNWPNQHQLGDIYHHTEVSKKYTQLIDLLRSIEDYFEGIS